MSKGRLHFTVGLPRSGKSIYAHQWSKTYYISKANPDFRFLVNEVERRGEIYIHRPRVVISGDAFRLALHGKIYEALAECTVFAMMDTATRALLASGYDVMVDETSTTPETIKRYLRIDIDAAAHFIDTPVQECIRRAVKDKMVYLVEPILRMDKQLQSLKANWNTILEELKGDVRMRWEQDRMNTH